MLTLSRPRGVGGGGGGGGGGGSARSDFERCQTLRVFSQVYLEINWWDRLLCLELDVTIWLV